MAVQTNVSVNNDSLTLTYENVHFTLKENVVLIMKNVNISIEVFRIAVRVHMNSIGMTSKFNDAR